MFYITSTDGLQVEPLINIGTDFKMEQSVDGTFTVSFSCFPSNNNIGYDLLRSEAIITIDDYDFKVKQLSKNAYSKTVTCISTFFELSKTRRDTLYTGSHTLSNHLNFTLSNTQWTYTVSPDVANLTNTIPEFGNDNIISMVESICKYHQVEYIILPNNAVHFAKQVGGDYDYQYRYKHNVADVVLTEDTSNLSTYIKGYGSEGVTAEYFSPNLPTFGQLEADPVRDERFTDTQSLLNYIKGQLTDVPELAIESSIPELTSRATGERVWLIYEPLNVEMQTRILKQTKVLRNDELITDSVVFGNTLIKSSIDILIEQKQEIEDTKDEVEGAKKEYRSEIKQTDDRITLEVEKIDQSIATIDIKADNINLSVNNRITNEVAQIDVRANQIALSVSDLDRRTSSSISILNNQITLKVDSNNIISSINLSPERISINADRIELNGAVIANGSITGNGNLNITNDITVGNNIYLAPYGGGDKSIIFDGTARIVGNAYNINISSPSTSITGGDVTIGNSGSDVRFNGTVNFAYANVIGVAQANSNGIGISTSAGVLYVQVNGSTIGQVKLT